MSLLLWEATLSSLSLRLLFALLRIERRGGTWLSATIKLGVVTEALLLTATVVTVAAVTLAVLATGMLVTGVEVGVVDDDDDDDDDPLLLLL